MKPHQFGKHARAHRGGNRSAIFNKRRENDTLSSIRLIRGVLAVPVALRTRLIQSSSRSRQLKGLRNSSEAELGVHAPRLSLFVRRGRLVDVDPGFRVRRGGAASYRA